MTTADTITPTRQGQERVQDTAPPTVHPDTVAAAVVTMATTEEGEEERALFTAHRTDPLPIPPCTTVGNTATTHQMATQSLSGDQDLSTEKTIFRQNYFLYRRLIK